jgi:glycosyltransferase involved in cell wall biosynthesis
VVTLLADPARRSQASAPLPVRARHILKIAPTAFFSDYGCHVRIYEESVALQGRGHSVTVCTYNGGGDAPGVDIRRALPTPGGKNVRVGSSFHRFYLDALLSLRTAQVALRRRPDIVHAHLHEGTLIGWPISWTRRAPLILDFQGSLTSEMLDHGFIRRDSRRFGLMRRLELAITRLPDAVIASSKNAASLLIAEFGFPKRRVFTVADAVNADVFRPRWDTPADEGLRRRLGLPEDRLLVVYLGLLAEYQGAGKLLEAAALLVRRGLPVHFLIMGFPGEERYAQLAADLGIAAHTTFTGRIPYAEAPRYLRLGDLAVSPKLSETEGNGKLLNYMATGLPSVTFDTPVAREILGELGVYARPGDAASLADALAGLLGDGSARAQLGHALRERALTHFSWRAAAEQIEAIYDLLD